MSLSETKSQLTAVRREKISLLCLRCSLALNIVLAAFKFVVASLSGSVSIMADAFNNLSDSGSDIVALAGVKLSSKPVDREHPFGHGRFEYISALVVSFVIINMGLSLIVDSVKNIVSPKPVSFSAVYAGVLVFSIAVKLSMAVYNFKMYKVTGNLNLKAAGTDSATDCISTAAVLASMIISKLTGYYRADGIVGAGVGIAVVVSGIEIVRSVINPLLGQAPAEDLVNDIENIITSSDRISGVHDLIIHDYGPGRRFASAHAEVPCDCDLITIHNIIDSVEREIKHKYNIIISIHIDPVVNNFQTDKYKKLTQNIVFNYDKSYSVHDFRLVDGDKKILIFDLVTPFECVDSEKVISDIENAFKSYDDSIMCVINFEHPFTS